MGTTTTFPTARAEYCRIPPQPTVLRTSTGTWVTLWANGRLAAGPDWTIGRTSDGEGQLNNEFLGQGLREKAFPASYWTLDAMPGSDNTNHSQPVLVHSNSNSAGSCLCLCASVPAVASSIIRHGLPCLELPLWRTAFYSIPSLCGT